MLGFTRGQAGPGDAQPSASLPSNDGQMQIYQLSLSFRELAYNLGTFLRTPDAIQHGLSLKRHEALACVFCFILMSAKYSAHSILRSNTKCQVLAHRPVPARRFKMLA
jgi:hypothetical protein